MSATAQPTFYQWNYFPVAGDNLPASVGNFMATHACWRSETSGAVQSEVFAGLRLRGCMGKDKSAAIVIELVNASHCPFTDIHLSATKDHESYSRSQARLLQVKQYNILRSEGIDNPLLGFGVYVELYTHKPSLLPSRIDTPLSAPVMLETESRALSTTSLYLNNPNTSDVTFTFRTANAKLYANREFLSKRCEYFSGMFSFNTNTQSRTRSKSSAEEIASQHDHASIAALLKYLYTGEPVIFAVALEGAQSRRAEQGSRPDAKTFYRMAHEMNISELKAQALDEIVRQLTAKSAREELLSDFCRDYKEVQDAIFQWVLEHREGIAQAEGLPNPQSPGSNAGSYSQNKRRRTDGYETIPMLGGTAVIRR